MTEQTIAERTRTILAKVLGIDPAGITAEASSLNLAAWDSLRHMNVVLSLENEFDIEFDDAEIQTLRAFGPLVEAIAGHLGQ